MVLGRCLRMSIDPMRLSAMHMGLRFRKEVKRWQIRFVFLCGGCGFISVVQSNQLTTSVRYHGVYVKLWGKYTWWFMGVLGIPERYKHRILCTLPAMHDCACYRKFFGRGSLIADRLGIGFRRCTLLSDNNRSLLSSCSAWISPTDQ